MQRIIIMVAVVLLVAAGAAMAAVSISTVNHTSVLSGTVTSIVHEGQVVKEGDVLVSVSSLVGSSPASRAQFDGTVVKVLVRPGQQISAGEIVAVVAHK